MTVIAHGEIKVDIDDATAMAELKRIDAEFDRTMAKIDRTRAEAKVGADLDELRRDLAEAEAMVKAYEKKVGEAENNRSRAARQRHLESLQQIRQQKLAALEAGREQEKSVKSQNKELALTEQAIAAIQKREEQRQKALERAEKRRLDAIKREERASAQANREREREMGRIHSLALREDRDRARVVQRLEQERAALPRLQRQYLELNQTLEKLRKTRSKINAPGNTQSEMIVDLKITEAIAKMRSLKEVLERAGGPIDLDVDVKPGRDFGRHIRSMFINHGAAGAAYGVGASMADAVVTGFRRRFTPRAIGGAIVGVFSKAGSFLDRLGDMTVRLGPFTASIAQAGIALAVLSPLLVDVLGALGSLVSVVGAGTLGLGALSLGFLGGAIPAAIGFAAVLKPLTADLKDAFAASKAYNDAVMKYGKGSDQAQTKLKQFNHVMKSQTEETRKAFLAATTLSDRWKELTAPARQSAFHTIGVALGVASHNMGMFARLTNEGFKVADRGISRWLKALDSVEGRNVLGNMMENFNESLGPLLHGLGDLIAFLGKVGSVASDSIPGLAKQFSNWASGVLHSADAADTFRAKIERLIGATKSVGNFLSSLGAFLVSFFSPGVEAGEHFLDVMSDALDGWTRFNRSVEGRRSLADYFNRSVEGVRALWNAFAPLIAAFTEWAALLAPFMTMFLKGASYVAKFVAQLAELTGMGGSFSALAATLGAIWAVGKIGAATRALVGFVAALTGLKRAQQAIAVAQAGGSAGAFAAALFGAGGAKAAARDAQQAAAKSGILKTALRDLGIVAGGAAGGRGIGALGTMALRLAPNLLRVAGPIAATAAGIYTLNKALNSIPGVQKMDAVNQQFDVMAQNRQRIMGAIGDIKDALFGESDWMQAAKGFAGAVKYTAEARDQFVRVRAAVNDVGTALAQSRINLEQTGKALRSTKEGTLEHRQAMISYSEALKDVTSKEKLWQQGKTAERKAAANEVAGVKAQITSLKNLNVAASELRPLYAQLEIAQNRQAAVGANLGRAWRGMTVLAGQAEQTIGKLARTAGGKAIAQNIAIKFPNPADVQRVANTALSSLKGGTPRQLVVKIIADAKNANDAVRNLNRMRITDKRLRIVENGGREAIGMVQKILGFKLPTKIQRILQKGGPEAISLLGKILGVKLPTKVQRVAAKAEDVLGTLAKVFGIKLPDKKQRVTGDAGAAKKAIDQVRNLKLPTKTQHVRADTSSALASLSALANYHLPTLTQHVNVVSNKTRATGGPVTGAKMQSIFADSAMNVPTVGANATKRGRKVSQPTLLTGEENRTEFVIATNPAYRKSNIEYLKMAARSLGVTTAARGYMPAKQLDPEKLAEVKEYWIQKDNEEDQTRRISIAQSKVKEPESLVKKVGKDSDGNDIFDVDQSAIDRYTSELDKIKKLYNGLIKSIMPGMHYSAGRAYIALEDFRQNRRNNIDKFQDAIRKDQRIVNTPITGSKANKERMKREQDKARDRIADNKQKIDTQVAGINDSRTSQQGIKEDQHDARFREQEYQVDSKALSDTIQSLGGKAEEEKVSSNPASAGGTGGGSGGGSGGTGDTPPTAAEGKIAALQSELAMSQAGLGGRDQKTIIEELVGAQQSRINEAQAMLSDSDKGNDITAYGIIEQAANAISGLNSQLAQLQNLLTPSASDFMNLGNARMDLFKAFSSNLAMASQFSQSSTGSQIGSGRAPAVMGTSAGSTQPGGVAGRGTPEGSVTQGAATITVNNSFPTPPADPHTWSRNLAYELRAM